MPANKKYLSSPKQQFLKVTAAFLGGYLVAITFHLALAYLFNPINVIISSSFTVFIVWVALMVIAFIAKSGWRIWGIYLILSFIFSIIIYIGKMYNPIYS
ncbi:hypothetical protein H0I23_03070 [Cellulophaga sp. HaHaR_3_176]|uniref:hypothetical protein n=1 Tax=Cellulophaga sp. HaHaR_3_176 TaxID=1942464 RepID=UPI001C1F9109|nr:hypothetical protein [Cellulophaga sp. HaHaR_3_176]QWX84642.1 hypothetical protein H0I23_03070 [Cellulophaga sp. HaHaR_3_176]